MSAHILDEVGTLYTVLLYVSTRTCLQTPIEIDLYLTDTERKISWHIFLRHGLFTYVVEYSNIQVFYGNKTAIWAQNRRQKVIERSNSMTVG